MASMRDLMLDTLRAQRTTDKSMVSVRTSAGQERDALSESRSDLRERWDLTDVREGVPSIDEHPEPRDRVPVRSSRGVVDSSDVDRKDAGGAHGCHRRDLEVREKVGCCEHSLFEERASIEAKRTYGQVVDVSSVDEHCETKEMRSQLGPEEQLGLEAEGSRLTVSVLGQGRQQTRETDTIRSVGKENRSALSEGGRFPRRYSVRTHVIEALIALQAYPVVWISIRLHRSEVELQKYGSQRSDQQSRFAVSVLQVRR